MAIAGLIAVSPCIPTHQQLGRILDKDPEWRAQALFDRDEAERLISDVRIGWSAMVGSPADAGRPARSTAAGGRGAADEADDPEPFRGDVYTRKWRTRSAGSRARCSRATGARRRAREAGGSRRGHTTMKLKTRDDRVFQGTPRQIVRVMQDIAFGVDDFTLPQCISWVASNALKFEGVELTVKGQTDDELAASLVDEMVRTGLMAKM
jgi:hypothetical protein